MFIDSHAHLHHLDLKPYQGDLNLAIQAARKAAVTHILCVCISLDEFPVIQEIAAHYPNIFASVGLHPNEEAGDLGEPSEENLISLASNAEVVALGETGLDYYRTKEGCEWQRERFRRHIRVANELKKPLIIHSRSAPEDTIRLLKEERAEKIGGVLHCFTETWEMAKAAMDLGFYISFSGIITFKNAIEVQEVVKKVPLDRLLIETDSPYLAPIPFRGKPNEPAYVRFVAEKVAELRGISVEAVGLQTSKNFFDLFFKSTFQT